MENKKLIILLSSLAVVFGLGFVGMTIYSLGLKNGQGSANQNQASVPAGGMFPASNQELAGTAGAEEPMFVTDKEKQPEIMTGQIDSIEKEKLVLKQIASIELKYEIKKEDVGEIVMMEKNPSFNQEKAQKAQAEMMKLLPPAPANSSSSPPSPGQIANNNSATAQPEISDEVKKQMAEFQNDPELKMFNEVKASWSDLKQGMQINLITESDGKRKLTIFSEDFPMGPTGDSMPVPETSGSATPSLVNPSSR